MVERNIVIQNRLGLHAGQAQTGKLVLGASLSLTGSLAREGKLTQEGYDVCVKVVNDKFGEE